MRKRSFRRTLNSPQERGIDVEPTCTARDICELRGYSEHCYCQFIVRNHDVMLDSLYSLLRPLQVLLHVFCGFHAVCEVQSCAGQSPLSQSL